MLDPTLTDAGLGQTTRRGRWLLPVRKILWKLLRPLLMRQEEILRSIEAELLQINRRVDHLESRLLSNDQRMRTTLALGWDHVALTRRLAALEDHLLRDEVASSISIDSGQRSRAGGVGEPTSPHLVV